MTHFLKYQLLGHFCVFLSAIVYGQTTAKGIPTANAIQAPKGKSFALVVGISDYKNLPKLKYADVDAKDFYNYITQAAQIDSVNAKCFVNGEASRETIVEHLYWITEHAKQDDKVYIYLSGHGDIEHLTKTDNSLFLLTESPQKNYLRKTEYVDLNLLKEFFNTWQEENIKTILIVDACHSGGLSGGDQGRSNTLISLQQNWKNEIKLLSCQANEVSIEGEKFGGGRGLFSYYLTLGLRGLADKDNNKTITVLELDNFIRDSVSFYSDQTQLPISNGDLRYKLSDYNDNTLKVAKLMLQNKTISKPDDRLAMKGVKKDPIADIITNAEWQDKYQSFLNAVKQNKLIKPENDCAIYYYQLFKNEASMQSVAGMLKSKLLEASQKRFYLLTDRMYDDNFGYMPALYIENVLKETIVCLTLLDAKHYSYNKLMARKAFLESCKRTYYLNALTNRSQYIASLKSEVTALEAALLLDPIQPYLYLRIGDYAMHINEFDKAISNYLQYQKFLPKDEYTYNKLGLAYLSINKLQPAYDQFTLSININPRFANGYYNLYQTCTKMGKTAEASGHATMASKYGKFPDLEDKRDLY